MGYIHLGSTLGGKYTHAGYQFALIERKQKFDTLLDGYFALNKGHLGSKDRKCVIDIESIFQQLNAPQAPLASLWAEKEPLFGRRQ